MCYWEGSGKEPCLGRPEKRTCFTCCLCCFLPGGGVACEPFSCEAVGNDGLTASELGVSPLRQSPSKTV